MGQVTKALVKVTKVMYQASVADKKGQRGREVGMLARLPGQMYSCLLDLRFHIWKPCLEPPDGR